MSLDSAGGEEMLRTTRANVGKGMGVVFVEQCSETELGADGQSILDAEGTDLGSFWSGQGAPLLRYRRPRADGIPGCRYRARAYARLNTVEVAAAGREAAAQSHPATGS